MGRVFFIPLPPFLYRCVMQYSESSFDFIASSEDKSIDLIDFNPSDVRGNRLSFVVIRLTQDEVRKQKVDLINMLKARDPGGKVEDDNIIVDTRQVFP